MGELITIQQEEKPPLIVCPKCNAINKIDLHMFDKDVTKIWRDNCVGCGHELNIGILILVHPSFNGLLECLKRVINAVNPGTYFHG